jgi:hypothetical protein
MTKELEILMKSHMIMGYKSMLGEVAAVCLLNMSKACFFISV